MSAPNKREQVIAAVLSAVSDGRLSIEQLVRAAAPNAAFQTTARRLLAEASAEDRQPPRVRDVAHDPAVLRKAQRALNRQVARLPGVHVGLGRHYRGRCPQDEFGLVVHVASKRDVPPDQRIKPVTVKHAGVTHQLRVDVKQIEHAVKQASVRPGNQAVVGSDVEHGTLSGIVVRPGGAIALVSGHVARTAGNGKLKAREAGGAVIELGAVLALRDDATMDAALIGPVPAGEVGLLTLGPAQVRDPGTVFKGIAVTVLATQQGGSKQSFVDDVHVPATFAGGTTMTGLIALAPRVTDGGDSGSAVLDDRGQVLGFVVGASATRTFVLSATEVLDEMLQQ